MIIHTPWFKYPMLDHAAIFGFGDLINDRDTTNLHFPLKERCWIGFLSPLVASTHILKRCNTWFTSSNLLR